MTDPSAEEERPRELHRRTWELELLISGAIVVALLSLPQAVDAIYQRLAPHASRDLHDLIWLGYYPMKLMISPAIIIFTIHILARGLWVGLVGLNAVFPDGVLWDRLDIGPLQKRFLSERVHPTRFQERVDRVASTLFSVLFSILALTMAFGLWFALAIVIALLLRALGIDVPAGRLAHRAYFGVMLTILFPALISTLFDRILARRGDETDTGWMARSGRGLYGVYWIASLAFLWYPAFAVLQSNLTRRKVVWWKGALWGGPAGILLSLTVAIPLFAPRIVSRLDSYVWAPDDPAEHGMLRRHYDSLRTDDEPQGEPSIATEVPDGPWLRLYIPYRARHDNPRLAETCPESEPFRADGDLIAALKGRSGSETERRQALDCFARLWTIELDEAVVTDPEMLFADGPDGRSRGVVTYLDLRELAPGRHDLRVHCQPTRNEQAEDDFDPEDTRFHIPFWR